MLRLTLLESPMYPMDPKGLKITQKYQPYTTWLGMGNTLRLHM